MNGGLFYGLSGDLQGPLRPDPAGDPGSFEGWGQDGGRHRRPVRHDGGHGVPSLAVLRQAGLIDQDKRGKFIYYELNMTVLDEITGWIAGLQGGDAT